MRARNNLTANEFLSYYHYNGKTVNVAINSLPMAILERINQYISVVLTRTRALVHVTVCIFTSGYYLMNGKVPRSNPAGGDLICVRRSSCLGTVRLLCNIL